MKRLKKSAAMILVLIAVMNVIPDCAKIFAKAQEEHIHAYSESIIVEPTCTQNGLKKFSCSCGESYTSEIPANGHTEYIIAGVAPTCKSSGM
ncbi:MAG: hypothetical protein ACI4GY_10520, partial [Acutalibacteraceae bacterium]